MGRRYHWIETKAGALGGIHMETAIATINKTCQCAMTTMTHYTVSREQTVQMLFDDADLDKLIAARGLVDPSAETLAYRLGDHVTLTINHEDARWLPPMESKMKHNAQRIGPLRQFIAEAKAVYEKFEEVKAVLRWLDREATPGAIRYFFPTAMMLCPNAPALAELKHVPSRYSTPQNVATWTQAMKDASVTWAATTMLPSDSVARPLDKMRLTFNARGVIHPVTGERHYSTDVMMFNL